MAMKIKACFAFAGLSIALTGASASAATFEYKLENPRNRGVGNLEKVSTSFNDTSDLFTFSSTFSSTADEGLAKGAWLLVNDGPQPDKNVKESVIFYLDGLNSQVSAYEYDGTQRANSWKTTTRLGSKALDVEQAGDNRTFSFNWDMTGINQMFGSQWKGTAFDEKVGIWLHGMADFEAAYDADGNLSKFGLGTLETTTRLDVLYADTVTSPDSPVVVSPDDSQDSPVVVSPGDSQEVPEPGIAIALGITAATAALTKRRKQVAA